MPRGKKKSEGEQAPGKGHNSNGGMTDDQHQALFFRNLKAYERALADKKYAAKDFLDVCKLARADLGDHAVDEFKDAIKLRDSNDSDAELQARIDRMLRVARYMNAPLGQQMGLFEGAEDRRPATERAFEEGKISAMKGETLRSPYAPELPQNDSFIEGWHAGQKAVFAIQKKEDGALFDKAADGTEGEEIGDREATHVDA